MHCRPSRSPTGARRDLRRHRDAVGVRRRRAARAGAASRRRAPARARTTAAGPTPRPCGGRSRTRRRRRRSRRRPAARRCPVAPIALAMPTSSSASAVSVGVGSPRLVRWLSVREVVKPSAPASIASRASSAIARDVVRRSPASRCAPRSPITCRRSAPCGTWTATSTSNGRPSSASRNSGNDCQSQDRPSSSTDARDVLDAFHQLDEPVVVGRAHRREADAAVADDDGRDAVPRRRDHALAPRRLAVVVGVDVDEARA